MLYGEKQISFQIGHGSVVVAHWAVFFMCPLSNWYYFFCYQLSHCTINHCQALKRNALRKKCIRVLFHFLSVKFSVKIAFICISFRYRIEPKRGTIIDSFLYVSRKYEFLVQKDACDLLHLNVEFLTRHSRTCSLTPLTPSWWDALRSFPLGVCIFIPFIGSRRYFGVSGQF